MAASWLPVALALLHAGNAGDAVRLVTISSAAHPRPVTLEWRRIADGVTVPVAEQDVTLEARTAFAVGEEERVLRVREAGASPRSFLVPAGTAPVSLTLEPPAKGGEVFGRLPPRRFRPQALRLTGGAGDLSIVPREDGTFGAAGLAPGAYAVTPVYRGGVAGHERRVDVRASRTAELLALEVPETGAVNLDLGALCGETELEVRLERAGAVRHARPIGPEDCRLEMEGLEAGAWRASVTRGGARNEPRAWAEFQAAPTEMVDVVLEPVVRVAGTVTSGGAPAPGLSVAFQRAAERWNTATDESGAYEVRLGPPGDYAVAVLASRDLPSRTFTRRFVPGDQRHDIELGVGTIEVSVRAEAPARLEEPVELALFEAGGRRVSGRFDPADGAARFAGLEYGAYTVTGVTASGLRSRHEARAELTAEAPFSRVELSLARGRGLLTVAGADGAPLAGARADAGQASLPERGPGIFDLSRVPAGERVVAYAPDHAPACLVLGSDVESVVLPLRAGEEPFTLRLAADAAWEDMLLIGLAGSECPLSIDDLDPQVRTEDHAVTVTLRLPRGRFGVALGGRLHPASAPGDLEVP